MKIDDVTLTLFRWEDIPPTAYHGQGVAAPTSMLGLLTIRTDDGPEGHAFIGSATNPASADAPMLIHRLKPLLMGEDPFDREALHRAMRGQARLVTYRTIGAVDAALWDLAGKAAGLSLHQLLGGCRSSIPAYASSPRFSEVAPYVEQAQELKAAGFRGYKIHPPQQPSLDIVVCEAVREAVGDGYPLMLDSTWSYSYTDAVRVGQALDRLDFYWYEDPLGDHDVYNYAKLRQKVHVPIMATEYPQGGLDMYAIWVTERATDYLRGDIQNKGGVTTMLKTAHLAEAFGLNYEIHHGGNSMNNLTHLHVVAAIANCEFFEVVQPDGAQKYGMVTDLEIDRSGLLYPPDGPGVGAKIDFDLIEAKKDAVLS